MLNVLKNPLVYAVLLIQLLAPCPVRAESSAQADSVDHTQIEELRERIQLLRKELSSAEREGTFYQVGRGAGYIGALMGLVSAGYGYKNKGIFSKGFIGGALAAGIFAKLGYEASERASLTHGETRALINELGHLEFQLNLIEISETEYQIEKAKALKEMAREEITRAARDRQLEVIVSARQRVAKAKRDLEITGVEKNIHYVGTGIGVVGTVASAGAAMSAIYNGNGVIGKFVNKRLWLSSLILVGAGLIAKEELSNSDELRRREESIQKALTGFDHELEVLEQMIETVPTID